MQQYKGISKFKGCSLQNEKELSIMFEDIQNTGDDHWGPSSGSLPQETEEQPEDDNDKEEHMDDNADSNGDDDTPSSSKGKKRHVADKDNKGKNAKTTGALKLFNHLHSSLRNIVERTFGGWKMKWRILLKMPSYPMIKMKMIVAATMCLRNFIHENHALDKDFHRCDRDPDYVC
jgi:hypothetical protein